MKQKKLNLKEISNALSRNEMKAIMACSGACAMVGGYCNYQIGVVCCPNLNLGGNPISKLCAPIG